MMSYRRLVLLAITAIVVVAGVFLLVSVSNAPEVSEVETTPCVSADADGHCIRFPTIKGESLTGTAYTTPTDFEGEYILVVMPFDREQQSNANTWLPFARDLADEYARFAYYNLAVFPDLDAPVRLLARSGMSLLIGDDDLNDLVLTTFLDDRDAFLEAMDIDNVESIQTVLLNSDGEVLWRESGEYDEAKGEDLIATLDTLLLDEA